MNYWMLIKLAFKDLRRYFDKVKKIKKMSLALYFGLTNISLGLLFQIIIRVFREQDLLLFLPAVSEELFLVFILALLLTFFGVVLHVIARLLGGVGNLKDSLKVLGFSTIPVLLAFIPYLQIISIVWFSLFLIVGFYKIHGYSKTYAMVNILVPVMGFILGLFLLGLVNISSFLA